MFVYTVGCIIKSLNLDTWIYILMDLQFSHENKTLGIVAVESKFCNYIV
jgi:hypothetical protein